MKTIKLSDNGPININTKNSELYSDCDNGCILKFFYNYSNVTLKNKKGHLYILFDKNNYISYDNSVYYLKYATFTSRSSHLIDNKKSVLELYLVHEKFVNKKDRLIINILINKNNVSYEKNNFFKHFDNVVYPKQNKEILLFNYKKKLNVFDILPKSKKFYEYGDSNNKNKTINIIFQNKINLSENTIKNIRNHINISPDRHNNKYNETINYSNRNVINNNYDKATVVSSKNLRDTCVDIYKGKPKTFYHSSDVFNSYKSIFYKILIINLVIISILFILDVLGLLNIFKKMVDIPFKGILGLEKIIANTQLNPQYIVFGIVIISVVILIIMKPFEVEKTYDSGTDTDVQLSYDDKLRSMDMQSILHDKQINESLNDNIYELDMDEENDDDEEGMRKQATGRKKGDDDEGKDAYMDNLF